MTYIRLSIVKPRRGEEQRVEEMMTRLTKLAMEGEGCLESYVLRPHDDSGEVARITIYTDERAAEALANTQSILSVRSELHLASEPGHVERAFFTI